jgi:DNA-directed RNA polymerase specialized sigma24 family protein
MQSPVGSVKSWLSRGRQALAEQLNDQSTPAMIRNESS